MNSIANRAGVDSGGFGGIADTTHHLAEAAIHIGDLGADTGGQVARFNKRFGGLTLKKG